MEKFANNLLYWVSHQGRVQEKELIKTAKSLLDHLDEEVRAQRANTVRLRLLCLSHMRRQKEFMHVISPCLALLPRSEEPFREAVLIGARTPNMLAKFKLIACAKRCEIIEETLYCAPERIALRGSLESLHNVAANLQVRLVSDAPMQALDLYPGVSSENANASPPTGVTPHIYRMESGDWEEGEPAEYDVCRFKPLYSGISYFVKLTTGFVKAASSGDAVFLAARLKRLQICTYDEENQTFAAPIAFPYEVARALCLCTGRPAFVSGKDRIYSGVPGHIAHAALKRLGHDFPQDNRPSPPPKPAEFHIFWLN